ncbi:response regulator transcription factor [Lederbergia graminis]|uniref:Response regulator n=1 Tax=Lederbergia graminis TaxID=735518 RepID=A0ABW0LFM2_9BACI
MYNLIIVDDEPIIRFGLKASVNWHGENINLLGDFTNGEEALKAIKDERIDILITDIKMPVMDGLTLMKKMLAINPDLKVILVSSHTDFEYVHEGLKLGAIDYVLKATMEPQEFVNLIRKTVKLIEENQSLKQKVQLAKQSALQEERQKLELFLKEIIIEGKEVKLPQAVEWLENRCVIVTVRINNQQMEEGKYGYLHKTLILEDVQKYLYEHTELCICFPTGSSELIFLVPAPQDSKYFIEKVKRNLENVIEYTFTFGYCEMESLSGVKVGYENSQIASSQHFYLPDEFVFSDKQIQEKGLEPLDSKWLKQLLLPYDKQKLIEFLDDRFETYNRSGSQPDVVKKDVCDLLSKIFIKHIDIDYLLDKYEQIKKTETLVQLKSTLLSQIEECVSLVSESNLSTSNDNEFMIKAVDYIHKNYTTDLSLNMVANHVHISRNYFSVLFKQYYGKNFIDYVMELRIKKAKELLEQTSLKVYEVAAKSGFNDVKYFSKLFKKMVDYSPVEYRIKSQQSRDY